MFIYFFFKKNTGITGLQKWTSEKENKGFQGKKNSGQGASVGFYGCHPEVLDKGSLILLINLHVRCGLI